MTLEQAEPLIAELLQRISALEADVHKLRSEEAVCYGDNVQIGYATHEHFSLLVQGWIDRKPPFLDIKVEK